MEVPGVAGTPDRFLAEPVEEPEGRQRFEDRGPHGVEVDGAGHDGDDRFVGGELGQGDVTDVQARARVLVPGLDALPHVLLLTEHVGGTGRRRQLQVRQVVTAGTGLDGVEDLLHGRRS